MSFLLDSNLLIHVLAQTGDRDALARIESAMYAGARYSVITRIEILGWRGHSSESRRCASDLLDQLREVGLTASVVEKTIEIRSTVAVRLPDAIIAASALTENVPLMTRNTGDFRRIAGLTVIDPFGA
jgi:predicted nucleic acid-binding protein